MKILELLSPAKNFEFGIEAINHGADAVYIGAPAFGARAAATNSVSDIEKLINYAHQYYAKVFVTLNTIIYQSELDQVRNLIYELYNIGTDAIIIQDMSILQMDIPPIALHASTQAHNYDFERIKFLDKIGIDRIVLARELPIPTIKEFSQQLNAELEYFVHGALCVSFSGQCYFSYAVTEKSANRGECSQPCRMKYDLISDDNKTILKNKHLLSLKDLNLSNNLADIIDAGVSSLKIEGRMKNIDYVKNTTAFYRKEIDKLLNEKIRKASSGVIYHFFEPDLNKTFNRSFTNYFSDNTRKPMANFDTPKSLGEKIGKIIETGNNYIKVENSSSLTTGDGICFLDKNNNFVGFYINKIIDGKIILPKSIVPVNGRVIYRNFNLKFFNLLQKKSAERKIGTSLILEYIDEHLIATITDEDDNVYTNRFEYQFQEAKQNNIDFINNYFSKLGNTIFELNKIDNKLPKNIFIPASTLSNIKKDLIENLLKIRIANYKLITTRYNKKNLKNIDFKFANFLNYSYNISNSLSRNFYKLFGAEIIENAFELQKDFSGKLLMTTKYCIKYEIKQCPKYHNSKNNSQLYLKNNNNVFKLVFDCKNCLMKIYYGK